MLSRHERERDPSVVELMDAVGDHLGELLHASAQAIERQHLLEELLEARRRNEFLLLATQVLSEVVDYREMVERLAQVSVPVMADLCLIDIVDEDGQMRRMAAWHADPDKRALTEELRASYPPDADGVHPAMEVMRSGRSMWSAEMDDDFLRRTSRDERHYTILKTLGFTSYVTVPLRLRDEQVLGTVSLVSAGSGRRFSERDLGLAEQLAQQVSSVVIRARAYDRERRISHELQRHLLPDAIPAIGGWDLAARYLPAAVGVEVGGDWYDVVPISEHLVGLVVGDVEGHDLGAARDHEPVAPHARSAPPRGAGPGPGPAATQPGLPGRSRGAPGHRPRRRPQHQDRIDRVLLGGPSLAGPGGVGPGRRAPRASGTTAGRAALHLQGPRVPPRWQLPGDVHRRLGGAAR